MASMMKKKLCSHHQPNVSHTKPSISSSCRYLPLRNWFWLLDVQISLFIASIVWLFDSPSLDFLPIRTENKYKSVEYSRVSTVIIKNNVFYDNLVWLTGLILKSLKDPCRSFVLCFLTVFQMCFTAICSQSSICVPTLPGFPPKCFFFHR